MNWPQVFLVMKREYLTRVKSKGFLAATLLVPVGLIAVYGIGIGIMIWESEVTYEVGIKDQTGVIISSLQEIDDEQYLDVTELSTDSLRSLVQAGEITGYIIISDENITENRALEFIYSGTGGLTLLSAIRSDMREVFREQRLLRADVSQEVKDIFESRIGMDSRRLTEEGEETDDDTAFLSIVGLIMGGVIFFAIFGYGGYIMRGVIEEKTNRIVEVITSSVKPIELLTGKMAGVGALAITQIGIWAVTLVALAFVATPIIASFLSDSAGEMAAAEAAAADSEFAYLLNMPTIETSLIVYFVIFFVLGYLLYSSLFAAVGSASDSETDTQQLMLPIMAPIFIAYFILIQAARNPDSLVSVIGSIIPFFAPIVMISRIAITDVPFWQIGSAILLMILTFVATMWLSAKIYKVGILSYGGTASFKDLLKWIRM